MTEPKLDDFEELNYLPNPVGPSSRSCCKVSVANVCGSGSIVGERNGKTLVLTNAHVAGTQVGRRVNCTFPFLQNQIIPARIIVAAYSDRILMDWAVLECDTRVNLPIVKLSQKPPVGDHYTAGYPRCQGPRFQRLVTRSFSHNGTVWRWQPNSIGGQSGSGVHSLADNLQRGVLTWSWGGDGAGQTTRSIWMQYAQRGEIGFARPEGLIELGDERSETENGFFAEANITTLPIWAEIDDDNDQTPPPDGVDPAIVQEILASSARLRAEADKLAELARKYGAKPESDDGQTVKPPSGGTFGL